MLKKVLPFQKVVPLYLILRRDKRPFQIIIFIFSLVNGVYYPCQGSKPLQGETNKAKQKSIPRQPKPDCSGNPFSFILLKEKDCSGKREDIILRRDKRPFQINNISVCRDCFGALAMTTDKQQILKGE